MFEYLGLAYRNSDYTAVIAIMPWPECKKLVLKLIFGGGDMSAFVSPWLPLLERSLRLPVAVPFLGKAHEDSDHTAVIAVVYWRLHAKPHRAGEVVSAVAVSCVLLGPPLLTQLNRSTLTRRRRPRARAWSSRSMCVNWNELQYLACATVQLQPVATRLPGVRLPLVTLLV